MKKTQYIGVSSIARSGKDTFCEIAKRQLQEAAKSVLICGFADALKDDMKDFILQKLNLDVWSQETKDKNIFRPLLVHYAEIQRKRTLGRYWIEKLDEFINNHPVEYDVILIRDVRFDQYEQDELHWVQKEKNGKVVHLKRVGETIIPPNEFERENDPKICQKADIKVEWNHVNSVDIYNDPYLNYVVDYTLRNLNLK